MATRKQASPKPDDKAAAGRLLSPEEWALCQQLAAGLPPHSQRAQTLLAIDGGATQAEASLRSGLTRGQVRYWLRKFRAGRLAIFPEPQPGLPEPELEPVAALPDQALSAVLEISPEPPEAAAKPEPAVAKAKKKAKKKSKKKAKKDKKPKKDEKADKPKKAKEDKPAKKLKRKTKKKGKSPKAKSAKAGKDPAAKKRKGKKKGKK